MCGIFASADNEMLFKLAVLNQYRGSHSYSVYNTTSQKLFKDFGEFDPIWVVDGEYHVCHVQAPTTSERSLSSVHPAVSETGQMLWHNGIIKDFEVKRLQEKHSITEAWDTRLLLKEITTEGWVKNLSQINGSFACVLVEGKNLYVFRNEISPLFYDIDMNFSSVKFPGSQMLPPNVMFKVDTVAKDMSRVVLFATFENPYFFGLEDTQ